MWQTILTGLLSAGVTLAVCLINNSVQLKRDRMAREDAQNKQISALKEDVSGQISEIKADFMAHLEELIATQQDIFGKMQLFSYQLEELSKRVEKHNNVVERTYCLERKVEVQEEKIKSVNDKINTIEDENKKKN